jgi:hypothetical protein
VVIDSNAAHEFNENYIKAKSLMDLYKWYTLLIIKTLLLTT